MWSIDLSVFIAIIGGTVTLTGFFVTRYLERKKDIEFQIREKKIPIYEEFLVFYFKVVHVNSQNPSENLTSDDMVNFFRKFNQKAIVWFPDDILISYINWRNKLVAYSKNNNEIFLKDLILTQEGLMKKFRVDIGHKNKKLRNGAISTLYINDVDKFLDQKIS